MSNTPNYGYEATIPSIEVIDRDIKRIEDKVDANIQSTQNKIDNKVDKQLGYGLVSKEDRDQIIINKENILCLSNKVDCNLCKCDLDLHNLDSSAHQHLFEQKVDKQDDYGLISDEESAQIAINKSNIEVNNNNITLVKGIIADMYSKGEIDVLLSNKVSKDTSIQWHEVELSNEYQHVTPIRYMKDNNNWVLITGTYKRDTAPVSGETLFVLPKGFRPDIEVFFTTIQNGQNGYPWGAYGWVRPSGEAVFTGGVIATNYIANHAMTIHIAFKATK